MALVEREKIMCEGISVILPTPDWLWESRAVPENGISVDACIAEAIFDAWDMGVRTLGCCCGHFKDYHNVVLTEDKEQPALARSVLRGWDIFQWQLVNVSEASYWQMKRLVYVNEIRRFLRSE